MRKFLWVVAVGALVLALAAPAMALDFKFSGDYRIIFVSYENSQAGNTISNSFGAVDGAAGGSHVRDAYLHFRPTFETSDDNGNIQTMLRLRIGWTRFGDGGGASGGGSNNVGFILGPANFAQRTGPSTGGALGVRGVNIETLWAYLDFAAPWGLPLRIRTGFQPLYWHKGMMIDDNMAGVRMYGATKPFSYEAGWYRVNGGPVITAVPAGAVGQGFTSGSYDNNYDLYHFLFGAELAPWFNPTVDFYYGDNRVNCTPQSTAVSPCAIAGNRVRNSFYGALAVKGTAGIVSYDLDWIYGFADGGMSGTFGQVANAAGQMSGQHTVRGWALDAGVHFPIGPVTVSPVAAYATGDGRDQSYSSAFPGGISPSWQGPGAFYELIGNGGMVDRVTVSQSNAINLWVLGLVFEYRPVKALYTKLAWGYAGFAKSAGNCAVVASAPCYGPAYPGRPDKPMAGKNGIGNELSLRMDYTLYTGFKVQSTVGWLIPTRGDTAQEYALMLLYQF